MTNYHPSHSRQAELLQQIRESIDCGEDRSISFLMARLVHRHGINSLTPSMKDEVNKSAIGYLVTHTGYVYLMDRKARIRKMFSSKVDTPEMIETVNLLLKP